MRFFGSHFPKKLQKTFLTSKCIQNRPGAAISSVLCVVVGMNLDFAKCRSMSLYQWSNMVSMVHIFSRQRSLYVSYCLQGTNLWQIYEFISILLFHIYYKEYALNHFSIFSLIMANEVIVYWMVLLSHWYGVNLA